MDNRSSAHRNAANVLPDAVGAWMSVWLPPRWSASPGSVRACGRRFIEHPVEPGGCCCGEEVEP